MPAEGPAQRPAERPAEQLTDRLIVVADSNVPGIAEAARTLSPDPDAVEVRLLRSGEIDAAAVREADLLFIRSTVRCGAALLSGSRVRFVGTATIGTDHLDIPYLEGAGVAWSSAPGCNADSVVQWLAAALCLAPPSGASEEGPPLRGLVAGVVGCGNVGGRVARLLEALGAEVLRCDPPRRRAGLDDRAYHDLDALCRRADLLTLHVPLTLVGEDRTVGLLDGRRLALLPEEATLLNSCRGEVVTEEVLLGAGRRPLLLDVLPGEPAVDPAHVAAARLATPHIAGHSLEGKIGGTVQVYEAACRHLGVAPRWRPGPDLLPANPLDGLAAPSAGRGDLAVLREVVLRSYDPRVDDDALRRLCALPAGERGAAFRRYREAYPARRELTGARLRLDEPRPALRAALEALGAVVLPPGGAARP